MCGIFGFTNWNSQTDRLFPILALAMESRGASSWGASNGNEVIKKLGAITHTIDHEFRNWNNNHGLIFHTRAPSSGTGRAVEDAHPFQFTKLIDDEHKDFIITKTVTGIHNGFVASHDKLKTQYADRSGFTVDSQHIFKHILDEAPLTEITGSGAIAWYETFIRKYRNEENKIEIADRHLYVARFDSDSLHIAKLDTGEMVFASTKDAIEKAARLANTHITGYYTIEARTKYEIVPGTDSQLYKLGEMKFGSGSTSYGGGYVNGKYVPPGHYTPGAAAQAGMYLNKSQSPMVPNTDFGLCPSCDTPIDPAVMAICNECLEFWVMAYEDKCTQ
jgi:hypothetical protein